MPATSGPQLYEGLFLINQQNVAGDFNAAIEFVRSIITRVDGEIVLLRKWEDRKLAYTVKGQKRGTFLLAYFKVDGTQIVNIERDCTLSDIVLRNLIIKADHIGQTELDVLAKEGDLRTEAKLRETDDDSGDDGSDDSDSDSDSDEALSDDESPTAAARND